MNKIVSRLKLYRVATVVLIFPSYWKSSRDIVRHLGKAEASCVSRAGIYLDMLGCLLRYGASDENYLQFRFYGKDHHYRDSFITWRRNMRIMRETPSEVIGLFLDKVRFNKRFSKYIRRGWLDCLEADASEIRDFISRYPSVIIKPVDSACGVGIRKIYKEQYGCLDIAGLVGRKFIIEETIENRDDIARFNPSSLNTLRIVTVTDSKGNVHILTVVLRMGVGNSITDNAHTGGIACCIDSVTGRLQEYGRTFKDDKFYIHPTTGLKFAACCIPDIKECMAFVESMASEEPFARLVGWDVALTKNGMEVLEANIPPGEDLTELDLKGKWHILCGLVYKK